MDQARLISVIVPVYKVEAYLDRCVQSIVDQTYRNLEIILVDDGSPDNCPAMCDAWAEKDSRIKVIHRKNGGAAQARNVGVDCSCGQYISFIDSDDYIHPEMYQALFSAINEAQADIAECGYHIIFADVPFENYFRKGEPVVLETEAAMRAHIEDRNCCQLVWNKLFKREVIGEIRFVEGKVIDDEFFTYLIIGNAKRVVITNSKLYYYRQRQESIMHQAYSVKRLDALDAKLERVRYIEQRFPNLIGLANTNLWFSTMYAMQMCIKHLSGEDLGKARKKVIDILNQINLNQKVIRLPMKQAIWFRLSCISFERTCRLRNSLNIGL